MYRRILVPVDGSAASLLGLKHAIGLAKDQRARLRVLNVVDVLVAAPMMMDAAPFDMEDVVTALRADGRKVLDRAAALAARSGVQADAVQADSRAQPVSSVILSDAKRSGADVIVMGTHGRRGFNRLLLGSDAERVLREAKVPVLLVRARETARRRIAKRASGVRGTGRRPAAGKPRRPESFFERE